MTLKDYKLLAFLLVVTLLTVAFFANQNSSGMGALTQTGDAGSNSPAAQTAAERDRRVLSQAKIPASNRLVMRTNRSIFGMGGAMLKMQ
jgi:hypothetical protein